jgi:Tfp pilus assembly protein PilF
MAIFLLLALLIFGCTSNEEKARTAFNQALAAERAGNQAESEALLKTVVDKYPSTAVATEANASLSIATERTKSRRKLVRAMLNTLMTCQVTYLAENRGLFAKSFIELPAYCKPELYLSDSQGYKFQMEAAADARDYFVRAIPLRPDDPSLYVSSKDGTIRWETGKIADASSPEWKEIER